ncbi:hypothetical protein VOLCADRAFT_105876 [Volvox carteri f. nagariensis]|uniref:Uncharacterized protein n=1 Tax=Volvox carteri f. nagariensis TaxID=3068 RepID=D8U3T8_VOLCA|nr:uncharacterized protein VOLCADRAFT_105876 [Volvox carteri f. nagariensis]EFJ45585.1 hypothetical protein VOLCADRAFT_105876 [Volvox carteri f. nagariensis]|eukprot:XP_002953275.1 hypothetical protein VOLCADRAFT_105876 [Volvox carteri f. nagariensis]
MPIASLALLAENEARVVCCGAKAPSSTGLKCRFGDVEVPARAEAGGEVSCCVPPLENVSEDIESSRGVPVQVLHNDEVIMEEVISLESMHLLRARKAKTAQDGFVTTPGAGAESPVVSSSTAAGGDGGGGGGMSYMSRAVAATMTGAPGRPVAEPKAETRKEAMQRQFSALRPFVIISLSYLLFTTTDGAVRMIVLLHAYRSGFSAWQVAIMFSLYETAGVVTNLAAGIHRHTYTPDTGMMGAKWGIKWTLLSGLSLQLVGISMLYGWRDGWSVPENRWKGILFMLCGVAKDLTKLGGKTVTKLVTPDEQQSRLFKLVSFITGWKNSLKGIGYFIGAACIAFNYQFALAVLLVLILAAMPWAAVGLTSQLGRARKENLTLARIFKQPYNINVLSVSRFFLFGSRDMWFEVPLPFFLRNGMYGLGWSRPLTGLFLAVWIIVYGQVQSWTPQMVLSPLKQTPANKYVAVLWNVLLVATPLFMGLMLQLSGLFQSHNVGAMTGVMVGGLGAFCLVFAVNSSIHSYLIVRYAQGDKVAMNVGFYYCANAMGRLTGTLVSGALYSYAGENVVQGFAACFWASSSVGVNVVDNLTFTNINGHAKCCSAPLRVGSSAVIISLFFLAFSPQ